MPQTSVSTPSIAKEGLLYDAQGSADALVTALVDESAGIAPGRLVVRSSGGDWSGRLPDANAADVDAIVATFATTAGIQTLDTAGELDGVFGAEAFYPPSRLDFIFNSHADWNATTGVVTYEDENGTRRSENIAIPDAGNATVSTVGYVRRVISIVIPAQADVNGTMTVGVQGPAGRIYSGYGLMGVSAFTQKTLQTPSSSNNEVYEDNTAMPVVRRRRIWVVCEDACTPNDSVYARCASGSETVIGRFRTDNDSGTCIPVPSAKFLSTAAAGGLALLEVTL